MTQSQSAIRFLFSVLLFSGIVVNDFAQDLPVPLNIRQAIDKGSRTLSGKPGPHYWQNEANYDIRVNFNPSSRLLSGFESITYTNNSPDTLRQLLFKLYPNLYKRGSARMMPVTPEALTDGVSITNMMLDG